MYCCPEGDGGDVLGSIQDFVTQGFEFGSARAQESRGSGGIFSWKRFKIWNIGDKILRVFRVNFR